VIPRDEVSPGVRALAVGVIVALVVALAFACSACACRPCPPPPVKAPGSETWGEYIGARPYYRDLSPDASHPGWPGRGQVCGGGKCE